MIKREGETEKRVCQNYHRRMITKRVARMGSGPEIGNYLEHRCTAQYSSSNGCLNVCCKKHHGSASSRRAVADLKAVKVSGKGRQRPPTNGFSSSTAACRAKDNVKSSMQPSADTEPVLIYLSDDSVDGENKRRRTDKEKTQVKESPNMNADNHEVSLPGVGNLKKKLRKANLRALVEKRIRKRAEAASSQAKFAQKVAEKKLSSCQDYIKVLLGQMEKQLGCAKELKMNQELLIKAQAKMVDTCTSEYDQAICLAKEHGLQL